MVNGTIKKNDILFIKLEKPKHKCTVQISADPKIIRSKMKKMKSNLQ